MDSSVDRADPAFRHKLRMAGAGLVKSAIHARARQEPEFLAPEDYLRWGREGVENENRSCAFLLGQVKTLLADFERNFVNPHGSIAVQSDVDQEEFIDSVLDRVFCFFCGDLDEAINAAKRDETVDWDDLADWSELPAIRELLDRLPEHPPQPEPTVEPPPGPQPVAESQRVKLFEFGTVPVALVDDEQIEKLSEAQFNVVQTLLQAGAKGLTKDELVRKSGHTDARGILRRLADSDERWENVISFAEAVGRGYRIL